MDEKNEELVDAQIVEEDSRMYGHAEGEPGGEVADEPALVPVSYTHLRAHET